MEEEIIKISDIVGITGGRLIGESLDPVVMQLATDSRALFGVHDVMFVAIRGVNHDGNKYIDEVYEKGIRIFLTDRNPITEGRDGAVFCLVDDVIAALHAIAKFKRDNFSGTLISITGSNGKTIVKEWLYQILERSCRVIRSPRSYNSQLGVPLSLWLLNNSFEFALIEAGISMPGEMKKLEEIIRPDIGLFTNIGPAHGENFASSKIKLEEKLTLFNGADKLIYNNDVSVDGININNVFSFEKVIRISWSFKGGAFYNWSVFQLQNGSVSIKLNKHEGANFNLPFSDKASIENLTNVITLLLELGLDPKQIKEGIASLEPVKMRLETLKGIHGSTLVNDGYNSDLSGLKVALDVLSLQMQHKRKIVIMSDLLQSEPDKSRLYNEVAGVLAFNDVDQVVCIGNELSLHSNLLNIEAVFYPDVETFLEKFDKRNITNSAVLIKGARNYRFERITRELQLQYHQTILEVDINALRNNLNYFRSLLKPGVKIMVMVKALSYGSGAHEIAGYLQHEQVDYLAVAFPDEGLRLRQNGVTLPVMVMNANPGDYRQLIDNQLEPEVFSKEGLLEYMRECRYQGKFGLPVHLKLDTGMHRLGFQEDDTAWLCETLRNTDVKVKSIFTHLAGSNNESLDGFTSLQVEIMKRMANRIMEVAGEPVILHVLNTSGIERFPDYQFDMVRLGVGLYGVGRGKVLAPVSKFKTVISQIRKLDAGETVSYERSGLVTKKSWIATIPVGYADGIDRRLGNGNYKFLVKEKLVPTIGNICMDMTMLDVTGIDVAVGDEVELFGPDLPVENMASTLNTIVYEVFTSIPERVKRVYIRE